MAKVRGPILSMRARGQIAGSQVYASWRGVPYARQYVEPSNPRTNEQLLTREPFSWLQAAWRYGPAILATVHRAAAEGRPLTDRNLWTRANLPAMRTANDIDSLTTSPGARGGPSIDSATFNPGPNPGEITATINAPQLPTGWALTAAHVLALIQQDPHDEFDPPWYSASAPGPSPITVTLTGLSAGNPYVVTAFLEYARPDGRDAFSASVVDTVNLP